MIHNRQKGMTLIELVIVLSILAIIITAIAPMIYEPVRNAKIGGGIEEARKIATACNLVRVKPVSSTRGATTLQVTHTYAGPYNSWTNVTVLKDRLSSDYGLPLTNPFGLPYLFKMTPHSCSVALDVDSVVDGWVGQELEVIGDVTRFVVGTPSNSIEKASWVKHQNRFLHGDATR